MTARRSNSRVGIDPNPDVLVTLEKHAPSAERSSMSVTCVRGLARAVNRAPLVGVILLALALAGVFEFILLNSIARNNIVDIGDESAPNVRQPCTIPRDCGGFHHRFALAALWTAATYLWLRKDVLNAAHVCKTLFWLVALTLAARCMLRVLPGASLPTIKGAFIITTDGQRQEQLSTLLDASFPQAGIPVVLQPSLIGTDTLGADGRIPADLTARDSTGAHMAVLEAISQAESMPLRDTHNGMKEWFVVLEENAVLSSSALPASTAAQQFLVAPADLAATLQGLFEQLPKRAQAINLGPCRGQVLSILRFGEKACGILGWDALNFASGVVSAPLVLPLAGLVAKGRTGLMNKKKHAVSTAGGNEEIGGDIIESLGAAKANEENNAASLSSPPSSIALYRGFGLCRHAYAVTPAGARWMLEVLLNHELTRREEEDGFLAAGEVVDEREVVEDNALGNGQHQTKGSSSTGSSTADNTESEATNKVMSASGALRKLWLLANAKDEAVANAAIRDYRHHQTYFTRLFGKAEWAGCGASPQ